MKFLGQKWLFHRSFAHPWGGGFQTEGEMGRRCLTPAGKGRGDVKRLLAQSPGSGRAVPRARQHQPSPRKRSRFAAGRRLGFVRAMEK